MADHFAQQVVAAVAAKLAGLSTTGSNVFTADDFPKESAKLPCINIMAAGFSRDRVASRNGRPEVRNNLDIQIQCVAREKDSARATAWQIAKEVEARWLASLADERLTTNNVPLVHRAELTGADIETDTGGDRPVAVVTMNFAVTVRSIEGRPDLA